MQTRRASPPRQSVRATGQQKPNEPVHNSSKWGQKNTTISMHVASKAEELSWGNKNRGSSYKNWSAQADVAELLANHGLVGVWIVKSNVAISSFQSHTERTLLGSLTLIKFFLLMNLSNFLLAPPTEPSLVFILKLPNPMTTGYRWSQMLLPDMSWVLNFLVVNSFWAWVIFWIRLCYVYISIFL